MVKVSSLHDMAGVLMQLCCGALMWLGQSACVGVDASYYIIVITVLRRTFFVFPHCCKHTNKNCTDREGDLVVECVHVRVSPQT